MRKHANQTEGQCKSSVFLKSIGTQSMKKDKDLPPGERQVKKCDTQMGLGILEPIPPHLKALLRP